MANYRAFLIVQLAKNPPAMLETPVWLLGQEFHWRRNRLPTPVFLAFICGSAGKESTCNAGDVGSISGLGRFPGEEKWYPIQYSWPGEFQWLQRVRHDWATFIANYSVNFLSSPPPISSRKKNTFPNFSQNYWNLNNIKGKEMKQKVLYLAILYVSVSFWL